MIVPSQQKPTLAAFPATNTSPDVPKSDFGTILAEIRPFVHLTHSTSTAPSRTELEDPSKEGISGPDSSDWVAMPGTMPTSVTPDVPVDPAGGVLSPHGRTEPALDAPQDSVTAMAFAELSLDAEEISVSSPTAGKPIGSVLMPQQPMAANPSSLSAYSAMLDTVFSEHRVADSDQPPALSVAAIPTVSVPASDPGPVSPQSTLHPASSFLAPADQPERQVEQAVDSFAERGPHQWGSKGDTAVVAKKIVSNIAQNADLLLRQTASQRPDLGHYPLSASAIAAASSPDVGSFQYDPTEVMPPRPGLVAAAPKGTTRLEMHTGTQIAVATLAQSKSDEKVLAENGSEILPSVPQDHPGPDNSPLIHPVDLSDQSVTTTAETDVSLSGHPTAHSTATPLMVESNPGQGFTLANETLGNRPSVNQAPLAAEVVRLIQAIPDGPVVLTLSPRDLGTLQFEVTQTDRGLHIQLAVDKPETFDLLRRQADELLADLRQAGFSGASLSFTWGGAQDSPAARGQNPDQTEISPEQAQPAQKPQQALPLGALDLRL